MSKLKQQHIRILFARIMLVCLCVCGLGLSVPMIVNAETTPGNTSNEDGFADYSFYNLAHAAASALGKASIEEDSAQIEKFAGTTNATMGGAFGYTDKGLSREIYGAWKAMTARGVESVDYATYMGEGRVAKMGGMNMGGVAYIGLGAALRDLGIDATGSSTETVGLFSARGIVGSLTILMFQLSQSVVLVFALVIRALHWVNPFQFFKEVTISSSFADKMRALTSTSGELGMLEGSGISKAVSTWWDNLYELGLAILGFMLVVIVIRALAPWGKHRIEGLRAWFVRGLFITGGIALLGGTYTHLLDWLRSSMETGNDAAVKVVASTFCDFGSWAYAGMPMDGISLNVRSNSGVLSSGVNENAQTLCYQINQKGYLNGTTIGEFSTLNQVSSGADYSGFIKEVQTSAKSKYQDVGGVGVGARPSGVSGMVEVPAAQATLALLNSYKEGTKVNSTDYETQWKANWWLPDVAGGAGKALEEYIAASRNATEILDDNPASNGRWTSATVTMDSGSVSNPFGPGTGNATAKAPGSNGGGTTERSFSMTARATRDGADSGGQNISQCMSGMSAMAIYNYLNTVFDETSHRTYSTEESASSYTKDAHYAVNLVGNGLGSLIIWLTCMVLLATYTILGIVYGFGIIFNNIKRGFRLIVAVPGAMIGSLQAIAKVVSYTVLMIMEVVVHIFLYALSTDLLYSFAMIVSGELARLGKTAFGSGVAIILSPIIGMLTIAILVWFTKQLIALRKPIIKSLEEMADNVVQKFIVQGTPAVAGAGGGAGAGNNQFATGAAAGAAAGAASRSRATKPLEAAALAGGGVGAAVVGAKRLRERKKAKDAEREAKGELMLSQMFGGNGSAVQEERTLDAVAQAKRENRRQAAQERLTGGVTAAVGAAKVAVGTTTGNHALTAQGMQQVSEGGLAIQDAGNNQSYRNAAMMAQATQANGGNATTETLTSAHKVKQIDGINVEREAQVVSGAGGQNVAAALASSSGAGAFAQSIGGQTVKATQQIGIDQQTVAKVVGGNMSQNAVQAALLSSSGAGAVAQSIGNQTVKATQQIGIDQQTVAKVLGGNTPQNAVQAALASAGNMGVINTTTQQTANNMVNTKILNTQGATTVVGQGFAQPVQMQGQTFTTRTQNTQQNIHDLSLQNVRGAVHQSGYVPTQENVQGVNLRSQTMDRQLNMRNKQIENFKAGTIGADPGNV